MNRVYLLYREVKDTLRIGTCCALVYTSLGTIQLVSKRCREILPCENFAGLSTIVFLEV